MFKNIADLFALGQDAQHAAEKNNDYRDFEYYELANIIFFLLMRVCVLGGTITEKIEGEEGPIKWDLSLTYECSKDDHQYDLVAVCEDGFRLAIPLPKLNAVSAVIAYESGKHMRRGSVAAFASERRNSTPTLPELWSQFMELTRDFPGEIHNAVVAHAAKPEELQRALAENYTSCDWGYQL